MIRLYWPGKSVPSYLEEFEFSGTRTWTDTEPLIRLNDYEALRTECESLRKASSELANWCYYEVGADIEITPGLKQVMGITGVVYDKE